MRPPCDPSDPVSQHPVVQDPPHPCFDKVRQRGIESYNVRIVQDVTKSSNIHSVPLSTQSVSVVPRVVVLIVHYPELYIPVSKGRLHSV